jgi:predicted TIM-barrel fold metal-dependent hydrolase
MSEASTYNPADYENVDLFRLLDELEELPERAKHLPFNTLIGFNSEQFYYLVLKIRANLPEDMKKAHRVAKDSERIVDQAKDVAAQQVESSRLHANDMMEQAKREAERMVTEARAVADKVLSEHEIVQIAQSRAEEIVRAAQQQADETRRGADDYAKDVLTNIEGVMGKAIVTVQRGRDLLSSSRS